MPSIYASLRDIFDDISNDELRTECEPRGILPEPERQDDAKRDDEVEQARYEYDTLIHGLRAAFLARDHAHAEVLLVRLETRYRDVVVERPKVPA